jgi:glycosyltransferase involved in cell wall biosynthesis
MNLVHVSPTYYSGRSVIGGGEKYIVYLSKALRLAAANAGIAFTDLLLTSGPAPGVYTIADTLQTVITRQQPDNPAGIDLAALRENVSAANAVMVHQCLSPFGLFVASHCRLAAKMVIGIDEGGGEHPLVPECPELGRLFDFCIAYSRFCTASFSGLDVRVEYIPGPVDTSYYLPDPEQPRDPTLVLTIGRILPHKGFDRIIRALPEGLQLVIAGATYDAAYYDDLRRLSSGRDVKIYDHLSDRDVLKLMQRAGLYVHASTHVDYRGTYQPKPELLGLAPLEALSTGCPALVSSAGALPELASIPGCSVFRDEEELKSALQAHQRGDRTYPPPAVIHAEVNRCYGLQTFGETLFAKLLG